MQFDSKTISVAAAAFTAVLASPFAAGGGPAPDATRLERQVRVIHRTGCVPNDADYQIW